MGGKRFGMKEMVKMSRAVGMIEKLARVISEHVGNRLGKQIETMPIFTLVTGKAHCYGYATTYAKWKTANGGKHEIGISAEHWDDAIALVDTITHEFVHIWNMENGIQDVSRGGYYHNRRFKESAEKCGLKCEIQGNAGWNTINELDDDLFEIACRFDVDKMSVNSFGLQGLNIPGNGTPNATPTQNGGKKSVWRHECPKCKAVARTTKKIPLVCGTCMIAMVD